LRGVVLAGGKGLRLRPLTDKVPKCLVEVGGKPILAHILAWLKENGIDRVYISLGYLSEVAVAYVEAHKDELGLDLEVSVEEEPVGTAGGLRLAMQRSGDEDQDLLVVNGDVLTNFDLAGFTEAFQAEKRMGALASIALKEEVSPYGVVLLDGTGFVHAFEEKPVLRGVWINAGIYAMSPAVMNYLPDKGSLESDVFPKLAWEHKLAGYRMPEGVFWRSIDSMKDIEEAARATQSAGSWS